MKLILLVTILLSGCATTIKLNHQQPAIASEVLEVSAREVNYKPKYVRTRSTYFKNLKDNSIFFRTSDMECYRGAVKGRIEIDPESAGGFGLISKTIIRSANRPHRLKEGIIDLPAQTVRSLLMVCKFDAPIKSGDFRLVVKNITDNPTGEDLAEGKILVKKLVWRLKLKH